MKKRVLFVLFALIVPVIIWAGTPIKSYEEEYFSFLTLIGKAKRPYLMYRTIANNEYSNENGFWDDSHLVKTKNNLTLYGPDVFVSYNTARPYGQNDGSLWQGVGFNARARLGLSYKTGFFSVNIRPEFDFSENREYQTMNNQFQYYWKTGSSLDKPQRFGDSSFVNLSPGDAEVRLTFGAFTFAAGYSDLWTGPTYLNSVLHSNNAPTYPRLDIGVNNLKLNIPWTDIPIGTFEIHYDLGILKNSDYANRSPGENSLLHLMTMAWRPSFFENLTLGFVGTAHTEFSWESLWNLYRSLIGGHNKLNSSEDIKISFSFDFLFPVSGFEVYGEVGQDDHYYIAINAFHCTVWQLGVKKAFTLNKEKDLYMQFVCEFGNMTMSHDAFINWPLNFYTHHNPVAASYSNRGQLLGAGTGWAGNSQYAAIQLYHRKGMAEIFFQRSNPDNNYILAQVANTGKTWPKMDPAFYCFKGIIDVGARAVVNLLDGMTLSGTLVYEDIANDRYRDGEVIPEGEVYAWLSNWHFNLGFTYSL